MHGRTEPIWIGSEIPTHHGRAEAVGISETVARLARENIRPLAPARNVVPLRPAIGKANFKVPGNSSRLCRNDAVNDGEPLYWGEFLPRRKRTVG